MLRKTLADDGAPIRMTIAQSQMSRILGGLSCIDINDQTQCAAVAELEYVLSSFLLEAKNFALGAPMREKWMAKFPPENFAVINTSVYHVTDAPGAPPVERRSPANFRDLLEQLGFLVERGKPGYYCNAPARGSVEGAVMEATRDTLREMLLVRVRALAESEVAPAGPLATAFMAKEMLAGGRLLPEGRGRGSNARPLNFSAAAASARVRPAEKLLALLGWAEPRPAVVAEEPREPPAAGGLAALRLAEKPADAFFRDAALETLTAELYRARFQEVPMPLAKEHDCDVRLDLVKPANWARGSGAAFQTPVGYFGPGSASRRAVLPGVLRLMFPRAGPCAMFSALNCMMLRALSEGPAGPVGEGEPEGGTASFAEPLWDSRLLEYLHSLFAEVALQSAPPEKGVVMWPVHTYLRLSQVREIFLRTCAREMQYRKEASDLFVSHKLLPPSLSTTQAAELERLYNRIAVATAKCVCTPPGSHHPLHSRTALTPPPLPIPKQKRAARRRGAGGKSAAGRRAVARVRRGRGDVFAAPCARGAWLPA